MQVPADSWFSSNSFFLAEFTSFSLMISLWFTAARQRGEDRARAMRGVAVWVVIGVTGWIVLLVVRGPLVALVLAAGAASVAGVVLAVDWANRKAGAAARRRRASKSEPSDPDSDQ